MANVIAPNKTVSKSAPKSIFTMDLVLELKGISAAELMPRINSYVANAQHNILATCLGLGVLRSKIEDFGKYAKNKNLQSYLAVEEMNQPNKDDLPDVAEKKAKKLQKKKDELEANTPGLLAEYSESLKKIALELNVSQAQVPKTWNAFYDKQGKERFGSLSKPSFYNYSDIGVNILKMPELYVGLVSSVDMQGNLKKVQILDKVGKKLLEDNKGGAQKVFTDPKIVEKLAVDFGKDLAEFKEAYGLADPKTEDAKEPKKPADKPVDPIATLFDKKTVKALTALTDEQKMELELRIEAYLKEIAESKVAS